MSFPDTKYAPHGTPWTQWDSEPRPCCYCGGSGANPNNPKKPCKECNGVGIHFKGKPKSDNFHRRMWGIKKGEERQGIEENT